MRTWTLAALLAAMTVAPVAAQETPTDTTTYRGEVVPVWVVVEDVEGKDGAHRVDVMVGWDDHRSTLRFATDVRPGELLVFVPKSVESEGITDSCVFASGFIAHESQDRHAMEPDDANCTGPPVAALPFVAVEHSGDPLACKEAARTDGTEDPRIRYYGCYWGQKPDGG